MFTITITTPDLGILTALANAAVKAGVPPTETINAPARPAKSVEAAAKAVAPGKAPPEKEATPAFLKAKTTEASTPLASKTETDELFEKVKEATKDLVKTFPENGKGRELAVAALMQFGAAKASDLNPRDYNAYLAAVDAKLHGKKEEELA